jgi:tetratricopeptide (TPR) repeat protein
MRTAFRCLGGCLTVLLIAQAAGCGGGANRPETASEILDRVLEAPAGFHDSDQQAVRLFSDGRFDEAFAIHEQWVEKHPNFAEAHYSLAEAHRLRGGQLRQEDPAKQREHLEKAIAHLRRYHELAINDDPNIRAKALAHMTEILSAEGLNRLGEAEATARQWVEDTPGNLSAHDALARIQRDAGRVDEGLATLRAGSELAVTEDERGLYTAYLLQYLEAAPSLHRDATGTAVDELEAIVDASRQANPRDAYAVDRKRRTLLLRAERLEQDPARQKALRSEAERLRPVFLELLR